MKIDLLHKKKCISCSGKTNKLSNEEININLKFLKDWEINKEREMIFKRYNFKSFKQALKFTNQIGDIAEKEGHHPDISFGYGYCLILLHTHAIKSLSINDFILASKINQLSH